MKNQIYRRSIIFGIILLFIGVSVISTIAVNSYEKTIFLDDIKFVPPSSDFDSIIYNPTDDTSIKEYRPSTNYGSSYLVVRNRYGAGGSPGYEDDLLIKFDISDIPSDSIINSATLNLFYYDYPDANPSGRDLTIYRVTSDWDEDIVTWNTRPTYSSEVISSVIVPSSYGWMTCDLTNSIQNFVNGAYTNYGWQIMDETYWGTVGIPAPYFRQKEYGTNIPYLEIEYSDVNFTIWIEDFDDGDISDWYIENPPPGWDPIIINVTDDQSVSPPYSLNITSGGYGHGANLTAPELFIDTSQPYSIEFDFRWNNFHYFEFACFENVYLIIDYPFNKIRYRRGQPGTAGLGAQDFEDYCPQNTWTHFRVDVHPTTTSYDLFANGNLIGTANFSSYNSGYHGFFLRDAPAHSNYINKGYWDNIKISITGQNQTPFFFDNFDDNIKDYSKWTEIYDDGVWEETNQRCEFEMYEPGQGNQHLEGIKSKNIPVYISSTDSMIFNWDLLVDIDSTNWAGSIKFNISDGTNWLIARYNRYYQDTRFKDSNDDDWTTLNNNKPYGEWNNEIQIFNDRYIVRMDDDTSDIIYDPLFKSSQQIYIMISLGSRGSQPPLYFRAGFDNILVTGVGGNQPPTAEFTYEPKYPTTSDDVQFIDLSYDSTDSLNARGIASWWWDFDDGYYSDLQNPMHCFYYEKIYFVSLTVTDNDGATDTVTHMIKVEHI